MPIATAGLYKVELFQLLQNQEIINTFWYRHTSALNDKAFELATGFNLLVTNRMADAQSADLTYSTVKCTPIFGLDVEVEVVPTDANGNVVGDTMPPFMAASIRLNRATTELRNGWKRIAGLVEQNTQQATFTAGYLVILDTLAGVLNNQVSNGGQLFDPVIVRKPFSTKEQSPNWEYTGIGLTTVLDRPTTQNSRKPF